MKLAMSSSSLTRVEVRNLARNENSMYCNAKRIFVVQLVGRSAPVLTGGRLLTVIGLFDILFLQSTDGMGAQDSAVDGYYQIFFGNKLEFGREGSGEWERVEIYNFCTLPELSSTGNETGLIYSLDGNETGLFYYGNETGGFYGNETDLFYGNETDLFYANETDLLHGNETDLFYSNETDLLHGNETDLF